MKIAIFAFLLVVVLTLVGMDTVDAVKGGWNFRLPRGRSKGKGNAHTLKNVNERMFVETEDVGM